MQNETLQKVTLVSKIRQFLGYDSFIFLLILYEREITSRFVFLCSSHRDLISPSFVVRTFASDGSEVIQEVICKKLRFFNIVWSSVKSSVESNLRLHWFFYISLCDWSRKLAPLCQPIRCTPKTNHDFVARVFPDVGSKVFVISLFILINM